MSKHRLVIVGFGGMGNWHRETASKIDCIEMYGAYDIKPERLQLAREKGLHAYASFEEVLADPTVEIVTCATPNDSHRDIAIRALEAGKNVVCEKPVALSSKEYADMADAAERTGKLLMVHQNRRWDEDFLTVKKMFEEQTLGEIFRIESRVHGSRGIPGDWRQEPEHGGGMILDWGVHLLDQALQMVPGKLERVFARVTHVTNELVDDGFYATLLFENGVTFAVEVGTSNFISLPRWYVLGRDGSAVVEWSEAASRTVRVTDWSKNDAVPIRTAAGLTKTMAPRTDDTIREEPVTFVKADIHDFYRNVAAVIEGRAKPLIKADEVMRVFKLMEAIRGSAESGRVIDFEAACP
jgi:scyllo-inositol 2-dehydrogenase (NADP+)